MSCLFPCLFLVSAPHLALSAPQLSNTAPRSFTSAPQTDNTAPRSLTSAPHTKKSLLSYPEQALNSLFFQICQYRFIDQRFF